METSQLLGLLAVVGFYVSLGFVVSLILRYPQKKEKSSKKTGWDDDPNLKKLKGLCDFVGESPTEILTLRHQFQKKTGQLPNRIVIPGGLILGMKIEISDEVKRAEVRK